MKQARSPTRQQELGLGETQARGKLTQVVTEEGAGLRRHCGALSPCSAVWMSPARIPVTPLGYSQTVRDCCALGAHSTHSCWPGSADTLTIHLISLWGSGAGRGGGEEEEGTSLLPDLGCPAYLQNPRGALKRLWASTGVKPFLQSLLERSHRARNVGALQEKHSRAGPPPREVGLGSCWSTAGGEVSPESAPCQLCRGRRSLTCCWFSR